MSEKSGLVCELRNYARNDVDRETENFVEAEWDDLVCSLKILIITLHADSVVVAVCDRLKERMPLSHDSPAPLSFHRPLLLLPNTEESTKKKAAKKRR